MFALVFAVIHLKFYAEQIRFLLSIFVSSLLFSSLFVSLLFFILFFVFENGKYFRTACITHMHAMLSRPIRISFGQVSLPFSRYSFFALFSFPFSIHFVKLQGSPHSPWNMKINSNKVEKFCFFLCLPKLDSFIHVFLNVKEQKGRNNIACSVRWESTRDTDNSGKNMYVVCVWYERLNALAVWI